MVKGEGDGLLREAAHNDPGGRGRVCAGETAEIQSTVEMELAEKLLGATRSEDLTVLDISPPTLLVRQENVNRFPGLMFQTDTDGIGLFSTARRESEYHAADSGCAYSAFRSLFPK